MGIADITLYPVAFPAPCAIAVPPLAQQDGRAGEAMQRASAETVASATIARRELDKGFDLSRDTAVDTIDITKDAGVDVVHTTSGALPSVAERAKGEKVLGVCALGLLPLLSL
jgi:hypothetical protein